MSEVKRMTPGELHQAIVDGLEQKHGKELVSTLGLGDVLGGIFGPGQQQQPAPTVVIHNDQNQSQGGPNGYPQQYPQGGGQQGTVQGGIYLGVPYNATLEAGGVRQNARLTVWERAQG